MGKPKNNETNSPDFEGATKVILGAIEDANGDKQKSLGDLSAGWKRVEDNFNVNKAAAKDALKIHNMKTGTQQDYLRSLFGMMGAMNIGIHRDMVDVAEGVDGFTLPIIDPEDDDSGLTED